MRPDDRSGRPFGRSSFFFGATHQKKEPNDSEHVGHGQAPKKRQKKGNHKGSPDCGEGGIRTPGPVTVASFQD